MTDYYVLYISHQFAKLLDEIFLLDEVREFCHPALKSVKKSLNWITLLLSSFTRSQLRYILLIA